MCIFTSKTLRDFTKTEPNCQILSKLQFGQTLAKGEKSFCAFHQHNCYQETVRLLACDDFEHG